MPGTFEDLLDFILMPIGHGGNDGLLIGEIAIDQADADPGLRTDIVHARLVEAPFGKANYCRIKDLCSSIETGIGLR